MFEERNRYIKLAARQIVAADKTICHIQWSSLSYRAGEGHQSAPRGPVGSDVLSIVDGHLLRSEEYVSFVT